MHRGVNGEGGVMVKSVGVGNNGVGDGGNSGGGSTLKVCSNIYEPPFTP